MDSFARKLPDDVRIISQNERDEKDPFKRISASPSGRELLPVGSMHTLKYALESSGTFQGTPTDPGEWLPPTTLAPGFEVIIVSVGDFDNPETSVVVLHEDCKYEFKLGELIRALGLCRRRGLPHSEESKSYFLNPKIDPKDVVLLTRRHYFSWNLEPFFGTEEWLLMGEDPKRIIDMARSGLGEDAYDDLIDKSSV